MTVMLAWLASLVGVVLFSAGGFLLGRSRAAAPGPWQDDTHPAMAKLGDASGHSPDQTNPDVTLQAALAAAEQRARVAETALQAGQSKTHETPQSAVALAAAEARAVAAERHLVAAQAQLQQLTAVAARATAAEQALAAAQAQLAETRAGALATAEGKAQNAEQQLTALNLRLQQHIKTQADLEAQVLAVRKEAVVQADKLRLEKAALEGAVTRLSQAAAAPLVDSTAAAAAQELLDLKNAHALLTRSSEQKRLDLERSFNERQELRNQVAALEGEVKSRGAPEAAAFLQRELAIQQELVRSLRHELEDAAGTRANLLASTADLVFFKTQSGNLTQENADLKAQLFRSGAAPQLGAQAKISPEAGARPVDRFERAAAQAAKMPGAKLAVVADASGFLVAGQGEHAETLAAFGAHLWGAGGRAREWLPVGSLKSMSLCDSHSMRVTVDRLDSMEDVDFVVTTMLAELPASAVVSPRTTTPAAVP